MIRRFSIINSIQSFIIMVARARAAPPKVCEYGCHAFIW